MRRWGRLIAVLALVALLAPLPMAGAATAQDAGDPATALLERYKPDVGIRTHLRICGPGERYVPMPVDSIFGRQDVVLRDQSGAVLKVAPTAADLAGGPPDRWIDLPGNALDPGCTYEKWFRTLDAPISIYGRVVQEGDVVVAQYWEYWVFNQWNDLHESDWEMAQVMFEASTVQEALDTTPYMYAYAQHEGAQYAIATDDDDVEFSPDGHRIVFAAEGSHASYYDSALWFGKSSATGFGCDDSTGPVEVLEPELVVLPSGDDPPTTGPFAWLSYQGHWGEQQPAFADGPTGPYMKQQWADPVTWVDDLGRENAVQVPFASSPATGAFCRMTQWGSTLFNRLLNQPWLILGLSALVLAAVAIVVLRSSQGVLVRAVRTSWRVRRQLVPAAGLVALGVATSYGAQKLLLDLTPVGDLTDALGGSSAWAAPLIALRAGRRARAAVRVGRRGDAGRSAARRHRRRRRATALAQGAHVLDRAAADGHVLGRDRWCSGRSCCCRAGGSWRPSSPPAIAAHCAARSVPATSWSPATGCGRSG